LPAVAVPVRHQGVAVVEPEPTTRPNVAYAQQTISGRLPAKPSPPPPAASVATSPWPPSTALINSPPSAMRSSATPGRHPHEPRPDSHPANITPVDKHHVNVQRSLAFDMLAA
jgi:hypothetical protein